MLRVKVKTNKNLHLNIPVPYILLRAFGSLITSELLLKQLTKVTYEYGGKKTTPFILLKGKLPKQLLKQVIRELKDQKGLVLVDVKLKDGTEVLVRL